MARSWFRRFARPARVNRKSRRLGRLAAESLELRVVPASTIVFQQGAIPTGASDPYAGTIQIRIDSTDPLSNVDGSTAPGGYYFLDGTTTDLASPNQFDLIRFDSIFGSNPGQIPAGSIIRSATLTYRTAPTSDNSTSPTAGPFAPVQLFTAFDNTTNWVSFGNNVSGPLPGVQNEFPVGGAFKNQTADAGFALTADINAVADITSIAQSWSTNPANNLGLLVRQIGTSDGWGVKTIGAPDISVRPSLSITYDPPAPVGTQSIAFQQGVNGYNGAVSAWLQQSGVTSDGATLTTPVFLDGQLPTDLGSPDDEMMLRFNNLFGTNPGQIPLGSTIQSARLIITTGGAADSANAQSTGNWAASQVKVDWTTATKFIDPVFGKDGPSTKTSRTTAVAQPGDSTNELLVLSNAYNLTYDSRASFDVTTALQNWISGQQNYGFNIQASGTADGWQVHFTGSSSIASRPRLEVTFTPPPSAEPAFNTLDLVSGQLSYSAGFGLANNLTISLATGVYTLNDTAGPITLSPAAQLAGWSGSGTNTVTGPAASLSEFLINTGSANDSITLAGLDKRFSLTGGGQAGDTLAITGMLSTGNTDFTVLSVANVTATSTSLIDTGTGLLSLNASNALGTGVSPILTKAGAISLTAGAGGAFLTEADGAAIKATVSGAGALSVTNTKGTLNLAVGEVIKTESGAITLVSNDGLFIDGYLGVGARTGAGLITLKANADGSTSETTTTTSAYIQGARGVLGTTGDVSITVNTAANGTQVATLATGGIGGTLTVNGNKGAINWNGGLAIQPDTADTNISTIAARNYNLSSSSSIGTSGAPIQTNNAATIDDTPGNSVATLSGSAIFLTDWGPLDLTVGSAVATATGAVQIKAANAAGHKLFIAGAVRSGSTTATTTGAVALQADDDLVLTAAATIGAATQYPGSITLIGNNDRAGNERLTMAAGSSVLSSSTTTTAVTLTSFGVDTDPTDAAQPGITVGKIVTGNGATVNLNATPTTANFGNIVQLAGTTIDVGANGTVTLQARGKINAGAPAVESGIGASTAPIVTKAKTVNVTSTNAPAFVTELDGATITATTRGRGDTSGTANNLVPVSGLNLVVKVLAGTLTVGGATNTDGGAMTLEAKGTAGGIVVSSTLNDSDTGAITLDAGTFGVTFNNALTTNATQSVTFVAGSAAKFLANLTNNGTITAANGIEIGANATLAGTGAVAGPVSVLNTGTFRPAGPNINIYNTGNLQLKAGSILNMNLNGLTAGATYDQVKTTGTVDVTGANLRLLVGGAVALGDSVTLVDNDGSDSVTGQFVSGTTVNAFNSPLVTFTINYAGGDGNDIVATVSTISTASGILDVQGTQVLYFTNVGQNNGVTWTQTGSTYSVSEVAGNITLTSAAITAGWTGDGTKTVTGPSTGITGISVGVNDGSDTISGIAAGDASISLSGLGSAAVTGAITTTKNIAVDEFTSLAVNAPVTAGAGIDVTGEFALTISGSSSITATSNSITVTRTGNISAGGVTFVASSGSVTLNGNSASTTTLTALTATTKNFRAIGSASLLVNGAVNSSEIFTGAAVDILTSGGKLIAPTISLNGSNAVGATGNPILTNATSITATGGNAGVYVTEDDGASFTATATGDGSLELVNLLGKLTIAGATTAVDGNIVISSADDVEVNANVGTTSFNGTLTINANTDGKGTEGFLQNTTSRLTTNNRTSVAASLNVNTGVGGTGNAVLGSASIGGTTGGTYNLIANGGAILWNPAFGTISATTLPNPVGGSNSNTIRARDYTFSAAGAIGLSDAPIQSDNFGPDTTAAGSQAILTAGNGGIFWADWGGTDLSISSAIATSGNIELYAANAGGSNLFVIGQVYTGSGNIFLSADDDLYIGDPSNTTGTAIIGGVGAQGTFAGTVTMRANRDGGNEQRIIFSSTATLLTSSNAANAVEMYVTATDNSATNATLGGVLLGNITIGDGGTVLVDAAATPTSQGRILQILGTRVDAGVNGKVVLKASNLTQGAPPAPATGAGIRFDLDGSGVNIGSLQVRAKTLEILATNTPVDVSEGDGSFFNDADGLNASAALTGPGTLRLATSGGILTIVGPTNTDSSTLTLSSSGIGGGIVVNAALGDANTGNATLDAGANNVTLTSKWTIPAATTNTIISGAIADLGTSTEIGAGATLTASNGVRIGSGDTLSGTGSVVGPVAGQSGSTLSPGIAGAGSLGTGNLTLGAGAGLGLDLQGKSAGQFDAVNVSGSVDITGAILKITNVPTLAVGDKFVVIANDGADPVTGTFNGGPNFVSVNDPRYIFTVNYAGGDGNDVELTVATILNTILDVTAGIAQYSTGAGVNNSLTVSLNAGEYTVTDSSTAIALTVNAISAGWSAINANSVKGPSAGLSQFNFVLNDGNDVVNALTSSVATSITGSGTVTLGGAVAVAGDLAISNAVNLIANGAVSSTTKTTVSIVTNVTAGTGKFIAPILNLSATSGIGAVGSPVATKATTITASGAAGGVYLVEDDGADFNLAVTGVGSIGVSNLLGTLNLASALSAVSGNVSLSSADAVNVNADIGDTVSFSGTLTIAANTDGAGSEGLTQASTARILSANTNADAVAITVNTPGGTGTGDAVIGLGTVGNAAGGGFAVQANGGDILWGAPLVGNFNPEGGSNGNTLKARNYTLTTTGAGSIGTLAAPIQTDMFGSDGQSSITPNTPNGLQSASLVAGTGGIYLNDWGGVDTVISQAVATGAGDIRIFAANAGGSNLFVTGNVKADTGNILLSADDDLFIGPSVTIGGATFSGTVLIQGSRDLVNEQRVSMDALSSIVTTNNSAAAVTITCSATDTAVTNATIGGIVLSNISVGDGGKITIDAAPTATFQGAITQQPGTKVNAGPTGTISIATRSLLSGSDPAVGAGIGTDVAPILVRAATVTLTAVNSPTFILNEIGSTFTGTYTGPGDLNYQTVAGAITIGGATANDGGPLTLTAPAGVVVSATLGDNNTGPIQINGALSGTANINTGGGTGVTLIQSTDSTYDGAFTGSKGVVKDGAGVLTLSANSSFTGSTLVSNGSLIVNGSLTGTLDVTVSKGATLGGTGTIAKPINIDGTLSPGVAGPGAVTLGNTAFSAGAVLSLNLNGATAGTGHDQVVVNGTVNLTGATLAGTIGGGFNPAPGTVLTVIDNNGSDPVIGTFAGIAEGASTIVGGQSYSVSYVGGTGNDVTLTRLATPAKVSNLLVNNGAVQRSRVTSVTIEFDQIVTLTGGVNGAFQLRRQSDNALVTLDGAASIIDNSGSGTKVTLFFDISGPAVDGKAGNVSLADGRYSLTAVAANITNGSGQLDGNGDGAAGDNYSLTGTPANGLFRLFGDTDGNGQVTSSDFLAFRLAFLSPSLAFDYNGSGTVDSSDFLQFRLRFLQSV
ncbi:MAG: autotransporter-associated beta strand repeat-containing protein [Gemmataceae bacterium]|nr:autotransporter-associated beta strand repeat-containing protein [Gemmataceae bacterium]